MPVFTWEEYKKRLNDNTGLFTIEAIDISNFLYNVSYELKANSAYKVIGEQVLEYKNAMNDLIKGISGTPEEILNIRKTALAKFDGFKTFLEKTEPGNNKNNYEVIKEVLNEEDFKTFLNYLSILNEKIGTGIGKEMVEPQCLQNKTEVTDSNAKNPEIIDIDANDSAIIDTNAKESEIIDINENSSADIDKKAKAPLNSKNFSDDSERSNLIYDEEDSVEYRPKPVVEPVKINKSAPDIKMSYITAAEYIEKIRGLSYEKNNEGEYDYNKILDRFLKIMAARMLADSERGKRGRLDGKLVTEEMVNKKVAELKDKALVQNFLETLRDRKNTGMFENAIRAAKSGHGGGLDDMFKDYIRKLPAGDFKNEQGLERFMPTGLERIENLQEQAKKLIEREKTIPDEIKEYQRILDLNPTLTHTNEYREYEKKIRNAKAELAKIPNAKKSILFEIAEIRNVMHIEKGKKSLLDKPVPTAADTIDMTVENAVNSEFKKKQERFFNDHFADCLEGHGGQMVENFKKTVKDVFCKNTISMELLALSAEAAELIEEYNDFFELEDDQLEFDDESDAGFEEEPEGLDLEELGIAGMDFQQLDYNDPDVKELFATVGLDTKEFIGKSNEEIEQLLKNLTKNAINEDREDKKKRKEDAQKLKEILITGIDEHMEGYPEDRKAFEKHVEKGKKIIAEFLLLGGMVTNPETKEYDKNSLYKEIPWKIVDQIRSEGPNANKEFCTYADLITPGKMYDILRTIADSYNQQGAPSVVANKLIDIKFEHDKARNPAVMRPKTSFAVKVQTDKVVNPQLNGGAGRNAAHGPGMS